MVQPVFVYKQTELDRLLPFFQAQKRLAVDTEFHREGLYFPLLALVQIKAQQQTYILDAKTLDLKALKQVLEGTQLVMHASSQDLAVFSHALDAHPSDIFDTQLAAGYLGYSTPSLSLLLFTELGLNIEKSSRLTDWLARPLTNSQLSYAASDVEHLFPLADTLQAKLSKNARSQWFDEDRALLKAPPTLDPKDAWHGIKGAYAMKPKKRALAQALASWREERAISINKPAKYVLSDLAMQAILDTPPVTIEGLYSIRGLEGNRLGRSAEYLLKAILKGQRATPPPLPSKKPIFPQSLKPLAAICSAFLAQMAGDLELDSNLLATKEDLNLLLSGHTSRLSSGWRSDIVKLSIDLIKSGNASIAIDKQGRLFLEARSGVKLSH